MDRAELHPRLWLIGLGMEGAEGLSQKVLDLMQEAGTVFGFRPKVPEFGAQFVDLSDLYVDGRRDDDNYAAIVERVTSSLATGGDVCLVLSGHPVFGVSLAGRLARRSVADGFQLEVIPACSSFDLIVARTAHDPLERGTVLVDANRLLLFDFNLDPTLDCYIFHASSVASTLVNRHDPMISNQVQLLQDKLEDIYGRDKTLSLCRIHDGSLSMMSICVSELTTRVWDISFNTTLFVPGATPRIDRSFAERLV
jgi:uncharacterized protein YabN with tetrapyrrole methylase and pyrophosphatase domain